MGKMNIRILIDKSGLSVEQVADKMGITRIRMYQMMNKSQRMRVDQVIKLASIIGVPDTKVLRACK